MYGNLQLLTGLAFNKKQTFVHCKKSAPAIGQNRSRDFGLSVTNRQDRAVMNVNLCFLV